MTAEPSKELVSELRQAFFDKVKTDGSSISGGFHQADLNRITNNDDWLRRFLKHQDLDVKDSLKMLWETCEWRKNYGTNDIKIEMFSHAPFQEEGGLFGHNKDKDGKPMLIFRVKTHTKGQHNMDDLKKYTVYWFERLERQSKGDQITLFFDMSECGLAHMDMEFTKYLINLFKGYYPYFLNYIIVYDMAWILNAAFKIIKSWLPPKAVDKIKLVDKKTLKDFIPVDQCLVSWGGTDNYDFSFVPEVMNGRSDEGRKKVHFADTNGTPEMPKANGMTLLSIQPNDVLVFLPHNDELQGSVSVTNISSSEVTFKIKTTSPEKFRVRPSMGLLSPQASMTINVVLQHGYQRSPLARDKFLIMALPVAEPGKDVAEIWKGGNIGSQIEQHRLKCSTDAPGVISSMPDSPGKEFPADPNKQYSDLISEIKRLHHSQQEIQRSLRTNRMLQWLNFLLTLVLAVAIWFTVISEPKFEEASENPNLFSVNADEL
ncbi:motile sperm domain-containing protein 2-like [Neocloeon triangulifer]|uniref:motile sperm domain-containing protein 2-like n=1 Tax=Neocloeon triangulifer TaxID=2078957 RepID=UPI00286F3460|nr:motile sperm domain-containing protein 2-like [Neocloeon triangulifer]